MLANPYVPRLPTISIPTIAVPQVATQPAPPTPAQPAEPQQDLSEEDMLALAIAMSMNGEASSEPQAAEPTPSVPAPAVLPTESSRLESSSMDVDPVASPALTPVVNREAVQPAPSVARRQNRHASPNLASPNISDMLQSLLESSSLGATPTKPKIDDLTKEIGKYYELSIAAIPAISAACFKVRQI